MLNMIGIAMLTVGGALILTSLILMTVWKVPSLVDEISGKKAKRLIKQMKDANIAVSRTGLTGQVAMVGVESTPVVEIPTEEVTAEIPTGRMESTGSVLNQLVNDPYGLVGKRRSLESATKDLGSKDVIKRQEVEGSGVLKVVVLEEQSSIVFN